MRRFILATASGAIIALLLAVICDELLFDIPARERGEVHEPPIRVLVAATVAGAICAGLCVYQWGHIQFGKTARYIAIGALLGVFGATAVGLTISNSIPLWRAGDFKVLWLKTMVPIGAAIGVLVALGYHWFKPRRRTDDSKFPN